MIESVDPSFHVLDSHRDIFHLVVASASAVCSSLFGSVPHDGFIVMIKEVGRLVVLWDEEEAGEGEDDGEAALDDV
jgi:hypothetical protein